MSGLGLVGGFHGGLVADAERPTDGGPGVASCAGLGNEFGAAGGHSVHPLLESGEGFEDVISHTQTVTVVAEHRQVCNHGCMADLTLPLNPDLTYRSKVTAQRQADAWNEVLGQSVINREPATTVVVGPRIEGRYPLVWAVKEAI